MCICVFLVFFCFCFSYSGFFFNCLFVFKRERKKGLELARYRSGEDLGGVEGGKTMIRIYCMKNFSINKCITDQDIS